MIYFLVTLFDSTKLKEDLNWAKISFKETSSQSFTKQKLLNENDSNKQTSKNDIYGVSYNNLYSLYLFFIFEFFLIFYTKVERKQFFILRC